MDGDGADAGAHARPPRASASAKGKKSTDVASSSGTVIDLTTAGGRTATTDNPEVVCRDGRKVKLSGPINYVWSHGEKYNTVGFTCGYCRLSIKGGGATRFREHLASISGSVAPCENVPTYIKETMQNQATERRIRTKKNRNLKLFVENKILQGSRGSGLYDGPIIPLDEDKQYQMGVQNSLRDVGSGAAHGHRVGSGSGGASCSASHQAKLERFYQSPPSISKEPFDIDLARSKTQVQPRVDIMLTAGAKEKLGKAWAKWFHANDIPGRKADCPYFRSALKLSQQLGEGVFIPRGREIDGPLLDMNYEEMEVHMEAFKADWNDFGVTIMCDSWTGPTMMSIINFMIFCNGRMFFHKSVDATGKIQSADFIYSLLEKVVVEEVGIKHVVQIVTDNGSNYKKACDQLTQKYPTITWQPCAAHTINLMLKDISRHPLVERVVESARKIYRFLYNHNRVHAMMKEKLGGELIKWEKTWEVCCGRRGPKISSFWVFECS